MILLFTAKENKVIFGRVNFKNVTDLIEGEYYFLENDRSGI